MLAWLKRFLFCSHRWVVISDRVNGCVLTRCRKCGRKRFTRF
jgi:hypothetical protein